MRSLGKLDPWLERRVHGATGFRWRAAAARFETWEKNCVNVLGLGLAVEQALDIGFPAIADRAAELGARLRRVLMELDGVMTHDLGLPQCDIVTASVRCVDALQVADRLSRATINVSTTAPEHNQLDGRDPWIHPLVRLSPDRSRKRSLRANRSLIRVTYGCDCVPDGRRRWVPACI